MRSSPYLHALEAEAMHIFRDVAGECRELVLLCSMGKDSSVLLHLAMKTQALKQALQRKMQEGYF